VPDYNEAIAKLNTAPSFGIASEVRNEMAKWMDKQEERFSKAMNRVADRIGSQSEKQEEEQREIGDESSATRIAGMREMHAKDGKPASVGDESASRRMSKNKQSAENEA
jgi:hypothetical protein